MDNDQNQDSESEDYSVGYGKTPERTRFKPGQSGNPRGRPHGAKNTLTEWQEELAEKVEVTVQGRKRRMSKRRAIIKVQTQRALEGKDRPVEKALQAALAIDTRTSEEQTTGQDTSADDATILQAYRERVRQELLNEKPASIIEEMANEPAKPATDDPKEGSA